MNEFSWLRFITPLVYLSNIFSYLSTISSLFLERADFTLDFSFFNTILVKSSAWLINKLFWLCDVEESLWFNSEIELLFVMVLLIISLVFFVSTFVLFEI